MFHREIINSLLGGGCDSSHMSTCTGKLNLFGEILVMPKRGLLLEMLDKYALVSISVLMVGLICSSSATRDASIVEMSPESKRTLFFHGWSATTSLHRDCWRCGAVAWGRRGERLHYAACVPISFCLHFISAPLHPLSGS